MKTKNKYLLRGRTSTYFTREVFADNEEAAYALVVGMNADQFTDGVAGDHDAWDIELEVELIPGDTKVLVLIEEHCRYEVHGIAHLDIETMEDAEERLVEEWLESGSIKRDRCMMGVAHRESTIELEEDS